MSVIQNFSVPANDDVEVGFTFDAGHEIEQNGSTATWAVYAQSGGVVDRSTRLLVKTTSDDITWPASPGDTFSVRINRADTADLLGNYYHEVEVVDANDDHTTVTTGIMTVTLTAINGSP